jgi:hypothetical protein
MQPHVTIEDLKIARDVLIGFASVLCVVLGFIVRTAYKMGRTAQKMADSLERISAWEKTVALVPLLDTRIGTLEGAVSRSISDIKELLRERRNSSPGIESNGNAEE